ncbi:hypothetical protein JRQ81_013344, partial [Phrynocephalus forsythii]
YTATMVSTSRKRKVDSEGCCFQDKWKLDYFFTEETVVVFKKFNIKRYYQSEHPNYDKLTGKQRSDKLKELEVSLVGQQRFFTRAHESSENATKASYQVADCQTL